jgi:hypothetical protein
MRFIALSTAVLSLSLASCGQQAQQLWLKPGAAADEFSQERYACLQQSQQPSSSAYIGRYGGAANSNIITNGGLFDACMNSRGWALTNVGDVKGFNDALRPLGEDQRTFCARSDLQPLWKRMACKAKDTTEAQLSDRTKISGEEKLALAKWQEFIQTINERVATVYRQFAATKGEAVASSLEAGTADVKRLASELSNGSLTWGEFNKRRLELNKRIETDQRMALTY